MAWLKSYQTLERHPKVLELERYSTLDRNGTIGVLHRFWYWVIDYAEDGNLSKWSIESISMAIGIDANHLVKAGFIDTEPELRVHDWFEYFGEYFRGKYRKTPKKYEAFKQYYSGTKQVLNRASTRPDKIRGEERREYTPLTPQKGDNEFDLFWNSYPKKVGKDKARESWKKKRPPIDVVLEAIRIQSASDQWRKENGQFIPNPATWINQGRWQDEITQLNGDKKLPSISEMNL